MRGEAALKPALKPIDNPANPPLACAAFRQRAHNPNVSEYDQQESLSFVGFSLSNLSLTLAIAQSLREIQREVFQGPPPQFLRHYTKHPADVESIIRSRSLWATCIGDQSDQTEISHASGLVARLAEQIQFSGVSEFSLNVLKRLPHFMEERKRWIFIGCFCEEDDSDLHWRRYGDYCLTFPSPWTGMPSLALSDPGAECWYQRVIYDEQLQEDVIERALRSISLAISHNASGRNDGPWAEAMVDGCARNSAQLLLGLAVGFKRNSFQGESEWRIVCAPRLGSNSSAPQSIDEDFAANIKRSPRPHILLQIHQDRRLFEPLLLPPVPFLSWAWNPSCLNRAAVEEINEALRSNHRSDLVRKPIDRSRS